MMKSKPSMRHHQRLVRFEQSVVPCNDLTDCSFTPGKVLSMDIDVPNSKNVTKADINTPSIDVTKEEDDGNTDPTPKLDDPQQDKMRTRVTYLVLSLFVFIVIYGLIMQNWWLVGTICFPVIAYGVYKIFDRYL
jgi:hypothetical protein